LLFGAFGFKKPIEATTKTAVAGNGATVPKDFERRKTAKALAVEAKSESGKNIKHQALLLAFLVVPYAIAACLQTGPTVSEQLSLWVRLSWQQLIHPSITLHFQVAVALLFIERICYTWVHTFSTSFVEFCATPVGRMMGKKPLDVVLTIFYVNKVIQLGTFIAYYFFVINFESPFGDAVGFAWSKVTAFQWIMLVHAIVLGQGLNTAIYRAIGKAGVYYGYRLGEPVPWVTGFPFSLVPHPQYVGVCMCFIGVNVFVATDAHVAAGWFNLTAVQVLYYVYMGLVEDYL